MEGHRSQDQREQRTSRSATYYDHVSFDLDNSQLLQGFYQRLVKSAEMVELACAAILQSGSMRSPGVPMSPLEYGWSIWRETPPLSLSSRQERDRKILRYLEKKRRRVYKKRISYDCRKRVADNRLRVKGRFISKKEEKDIVPTSS